MRTLITCSGIALLAGAVAFTSAQSTRPGRAGDQLVERGRYITHNVAMCVECHSPRTDAATIDRTRVFQGAPMPLRSPFPGVEWAYRTPRIAGLPGWTEDEAVRYLMTGKDARGQERRPPMPVYRMNREDATAVVAYLMSIK